LRLDHHQPRAHDRGRDDHDQDHESVARGHFELPVAVVAAGVFGVVPEPGAVVVAVGALGVVDVVAAGAPGVVVGVEGVEVPDGDAVAAVVPVPATAPGSGVSMTSMSKFGALEPHPTTLPALPPWLVETAGPVDAGLVELPRLTRVTPSISRSRDIRRATAS
jgi:hypothetical protein